MKHPDFYWDYDTLVGEWERVLWRHITFADELRALAKPGSYRDQRLLQEFLREVEADKNACLDALFADAGWTEEAFSAEIWRRFNLWEAARKSAAAQCRADLAAGPSREFLRDQRV